MTREYIYYCTWSFGGTEGRKLERRNFDTIENAEKNAIEDTWNYSFSLNKVTVTIDDKGMITEKQSPLKEKIPCGRDLKENNGKKSTTR